VCAEALRENMEFIADVVIWAQFNCLLQKGKVHSEVSVGGHEALIACDAKQVDKQAEEKT
jgi:hypothetical protein